MTSIRTWQITQVAIASLLGILLTCVSYLIAHLVQWDVTFSWLDATAVATSYACTWLCVAQSRLNYLFGIVSVALYSYLFWSANYNALALFKLYLVGSLTYGWFRWKKDSQPLLVRSLQLDRWSAAYAAIGLTIAACCIIVNSYFPDTFRPVDIWITALSGVAQAMLDNKRLQTWYVWFVVNIISMYTFYHDAMYIVLLQYVFFTVNVFIGAISWKRSM